MVPRISTLQDNMKQWIQILVELIFFWHALHWLLLNIVPYILVRRLKDRMEFYIRYLKYLVYHFPWIYSSIVCEQTTCCILLVLISRSSLPSGNWKQGSAELQKSLWLSHKISVWYAINCSFSEERPLFTITGFHGIDDTETLMRIRIFLAGLELRDAQSVWI